jgi:hypothetical protein
MIEPNLNQLNQRLIEQVNNAGSIELPELSNEYPEFRIVPEDMLWLIAHDLAEEGHIRAKPRNGTLLLYSVGL